MGAERSVTWDDVAAQAERRYAASGGVLGWAGDLRTTLTRLARAWELRPLELYDSGIGHPVVRVAWPAGEAVLKVAPPDDLRAQTLVLVADGGRAYARVLAVDEAAVLLERLGAPLHAAVPDPLEQLRIQARLLRRAWEVPLAVGERVGSKAAGLLGILDAHAGLGAEVPHVLERARGLAEDLAVGECAEVVCHGDAHSGNVLARGGGSFALVDPDGFVGERAYDLGVTMRSFLPEVHVGGARFVADCAAVLAEESGVEADRIEAWAFVERVTTGLFLRLLGHGDEGAAQLASAALLCGAR
ncbi:aminoglycoside phosphotransferase family protein [Propioniciclava soli]|uniref:Phosphotransferase n=1 Tax=Propioniciclava soli TaxID=2775081 RepID=A0ABZ3C977_9ACTN|nr:aminoglycoside phosphotransferase family protein [Propioniciclava soli]